MKLDNVNVKCLISSAITMPIVLSFIDFSVSQSVLNADNTIYELFFYHSFNKAISFYAFLGILIYCLFSRIANQHEPNLKYENIWIYCFSGLFGLIFYLSKSYYLLKNWNLAFCSVQSFTFSLIIIFSITFISSIFIKSLYCLFKCINKDNVKTLYINPRYCYISLFLINLIYLIIFYPGTATYDGVYQILEFYSLKSLSNHLPVLSTLLEGSIFHLGSIIKDYNFGLFLYVFLQSILQSSLFSYTIYWIWKLTKNIYLEIFTFLFFLLNPIFQIWGISFVKDTMYYIGFLWFILIVIRILESREIQTIKLGIQLLLSMILLCSFRNNGIYIIVPTIILLGLFSKNSAIKKMVLINLIIVMAFFIGWTHLLALHNVPQPVEEALSIPFQQTARLVSKKDLDYNDEQTLIKLFKGNDLRILYNPEFADPVKFSFKWGKENRNEWEKIYLKYLKLYPDVYLEAFFNQNYGYFYPMSKATDLGSYVIPNNKELKNEIINLHMNSIFAKEQHVISLIPKLYQCIPIISLVYNCSFYTWSILFLFGLSAINKKFKCIIVGMPIILSLGVCFLSPVDTCIRYMLPIIVTFPVFLSYCVLQWNRKKIQKIYN